MFDKLVDLHSRSIILIRHGEAEGSPDLDRQLTVRGKSQARAAGKALLSLGIIPDVVICSGVTRTRQTLTEMGLPETTQVIFCGDDLYKAHSYRDVLNVIAELIPDNKHTPLIIGHNPAIHETVLYLSKEGRGPKFGTLETSYPTGTATVFEFKSDSWDLLHPSTCRLTHVLSSL